MYRASFYGFNTALNSLRTTQKSMDIVGQNIANQNTFGYTRQRADQVSVHYNLTGMRFSAYGQQMAGNGSMMRGIQQVRDPALDRLFRQNVCDEAQRAVINAAFVDLEAIFGDASEWTGNTLFDLINEFIDKGLQDNSTDVTMKPFLTNVREMAKNISHLFNDYAKSINRVKEEQIQGLQRSLTDVNAITKEIAFLNRQIKDAELVRSKCSTEEMS
jgi:flagellar hook-associated protein 1 FlgK